MKGFRIATLFGIPVRVHASWLVIVILLTVSVAARFGLRFPYLGWPARISLGLSVSLLLFASVLAHELSHSVVALRHGIKIRAITLFIFGGAAEMTEEPPDASTELKVAIAGPLMSVALALAFAGLYYAAVGRIPAPLNGILGELAQMNAVLAAFNIIPGFPLDGGRVLRAALWSVWGRLRPATRVASAVGSGFGALIAFLGLLSFLYGILLGGLLLVFIGLFLRGAARASYQQMVVKEGLAGLSARDLMSIDITTVAPSATLREIVDELVLGKGATELPVVEEGKLVGFVGLDAIRAREQRDWELVSAADVMATDLDRSVVAPADSAKRVLERLEQESGAMAVVDGGAVVGIITKDDLLRRLRLFMELGLEPGSAGSVGHGVDEAAQEENEQESGDQDQRHCDEPGQRDPDDDESRQDLERKQEELTGSADSSSQELEREQNERDE